MSYNIDKKGDVLINGWEKGISDDPYSGISDIRNMNLISVPKEASVNFSTSQISYPTVTGVSVTTTATSGNTITFTGGANLTGGMAIIFSASTSFGITNGTIYYLGSVSAGVTASLYTDQALSSVVTITANSGTGTFATLNPTKLLNWAYDNVNGYYYAVDSTGYVWGTNKVTLIGSYWTFTGNTTIANANGRGLVCYETSNHTVYLFVFRNNRIDYTLSGATLTWHYSWLPSTGGVDGSGGASMNNGAGNNVSHQSLVGQDNVVYYCDANYLGSFFEKTGQVFDPTLIATPTSTVLPTQEQTATWTLETRLFMTT